MGRRRFVGGSGPEAARLVRIVNVSFTEVFGYMAGSFLRGCALEGELEGLFVIGPPLGFSTVFLLGCFTPFCGEMGGDVLAELL